MQKIMRPWFIPAIYVAASSICALTLPGLERTFLGAYKLDISVASAQAVLSAASAGMMALTAIVFAVAFVVVQFGAVAYSPRIVQWFTRDHRLFHTLGIFTATFIYSLWTLAWIDRGGSQTVPMFSVLLVGAMVIVCMLLFARLVESLSDLQMNNVLCSIGDSGRAVIRTMFPPPANGRRQSEQAVEKAEEADYGPRTQALSYVGPPRTITSFDIDGLVKQAQAAQGVIVMACAVGDTLVEGAALMEIHGAHVQLSERELLAAIRFANERTFEQDPKYPIRLLVDIAIRALSPAVNDPTTAVQTIDQIEDLLRRLGRCELDIGHVRDAGGALRLVYPAPTWADYLALAFDEIRQFGATSLQVMRRLRSALVSIAEGLADEPRVHAIKRYLEHLDLTIDRSPFDPEDRTLARLEDRQGLGMSRRRPAAKIAPVPGTAI